MLKILVNYWLNIKWINLSTFYANVPWIASKYKFRFYRKRKIAVSIWLMSNNELVDLEVVFCFW